MDLRSGDNVNQMAEVKEQLSRMNSIYHYIKDENSKPHDSMLTILGRKFHDENAISDYLAYVFDPELNGVGLQPLINFLALFSNSFELTETDHINIQREYNLPNNRRVDFLITINEENVIVIEHKVFSDEHNYQTWDYESEIKEAFSEQVDDITFVYLTPNGNKPQNPSFIPVSYYNLVTALKNVNVNFIADIRKAVLFNEIIFHLEGYFLDNKSIELSDKTSLYLNNHNMIQDLQNQFEQDYINVFKYIESVIRNYFTYNFEGEWHFDFKKDRNYHQIYRPHWKSKDLDIHFELSLRHESLIDHNISFMLDIEGKKRKNFKTYHDAYLRDQLMDVLQRNNIAYREGKKIKDRRADTFAVKTYHFLTPENLKDESHIMNRLIEMIKEFEAFIIPVEEEIKRFNDNR